jgi:hypothetical protein
MNEEYDIVEPHAAIMIESLRAFGYDLRTAIADLIDNSITAGAENIWLDFHWNGTDSYIRVTDDGFGMNEQDLVDAMRPGSRNPLESREATDLGRFGLGMKTASFSQCKRMTVASKPSNGSLSVRRWDLDFVAREDKWTLLKTPASGSEQFFDKLNKLEHGTTVLWEILDRVVGNSSVNDFKASSQFYRNVKIVQSYLSMIFHRYMESGKKSLRIFLNGDDESHRIVPWDPFAENSSAIIDFPEDSIHYGNDVIKVKGFVLPHKDKISEQEYIELAGTEGWSALQGFYIYRNKRLLLYGSWLGLGDNAAWTKEEQFKLARIRIDIPNSQDIEWQIDVKKSTAKPPLAIRERLRDLAGKVRIQARNVFAYRGSYGSRITKEPLRRAWYSVYFNGSHSYKIDRKHPLVKQALELDTNYKSLIEAMIVTLEETVPIQQIWLDSAERSDESSKPFVNIDKEKMKSVIELTFRALHEKQGLSIETAKRYLNSMDAFTDYPDMVEEVVSDLGASL